MPSFNRKTKEENLGHLNDVIQNHVLTFFSCEEIHNLRMVNKQFKSACDYRLKEVYLQVKQEVELCCEQLFCFTNGELVSYHPRGLADFVRKMFWFYVREFLKNSFCLFDIHKGYLDVKYSVNGKTIDLVKRILWLKDLEDPLSHLVELVIGRSVHHSNMKSYSDFGCAYSAWLNATKDEYRCVDIHSLYVPLLKKSDAELICTHFYDNSTNEFSAAMLDILSTLWTEKAHLDEHLLWDRTLGKYGLHGGVFPANLIPVLKPGDDQDPQLYRELLPNLDADWKEYYPEEVELDISDEELDIIYPEQELTNYRQYNIPYYCK